MDLETTDLTPSHGGVVCLGAIHGDRLEVRVRAREVKVGEFYGGLKEVVRALPRPVYAYNAAFDGKFLKKYLGYDRNGLVVDLFEPWRSRAEATAMKWPKLDELVRGPWDDIPGTSRRT